ncbi:STN domain-containing protein, partial [Steroidobacter sp.]|uniref:STN domain-containing protein n=1 Tax=Steroidobacter sp. TaxID=1978227 RepID=UPI001A53D0DE
MSTDTSTRALTKLIGGLLALAAPLAVGAGTAVVHFDIQEQALSTALSEFARQCDRQIFFATELVGDKRIAPVKGEFEPTRALTMLLQGTGLTFKVISNDMILVRSANSEPTTTTRNYTPANYLQL